MAGFREACGEPPTDGELVRMGAMNQMDLLDIVHTLERGINDLEKSLGELAKKDRPH